MALTWKEFHEMEKIGQLMAGEKPEPAFVIYLRYIEFWARKAACRLFGHHWVDHSAASPNSGYVHIECLRCGESHHETLY